MFPARQRSRQTTESMQQILIIDDVFRDRLQGVLRVLG